MAKSTDADMLIILSDIDAYYDSDPRANPDARVLKTVNSISEEELSKDVTPNNVFATGGIVTKLKAADFMIKHKRKMFLTNGFDLSAAESFLMDAQQVSGTLFEQKNK